MSWDDDAATWDDNPGVQAYSRAAFQSLLNVLAERQVLLEGAQVFDFGCGTGLLTEAMAARADHVVALDLSPPMIAVLQKKAIDNVDALCGRLEDLFTDAAAPGEFDLVTCSSVCAFVPDYPATLAQLAKLLRPGGLLIQWDWELNPDDAEPHGLSREAIASAHAAAGLHDVSVDVGFEERFGEMVMAPLRGVGRKGGPAVR